MHTKILMASLTFVSAFEIVLERKCMKSVITFCCQTEIRLMIVLARGLEVGKGEEEWGVTADGHGFFQRDDEMFWN